MTLKDIKNLARNDGILVPLINQYQVYKGKRDTLKRSQDKKGWFSPSAISKCLVFQLFTFKGFPAFIHDSEALRKMENGTYYHYRMENHLKEMGEENIIKVNWIEKELKNEELRVLGTADASITIDGITFLIDLKSANNRNFNTHHENYKEQLHVYMWLEGADFGMFLYERKDDQRLREEIVNFDPEYFGRVMERILYLNHCINNREVPVVDCWDKNCAFQRYCLGGIDTVRRELFGLRWKK